MNDLEILKKIETLRQVSNQCKAEEQKLKEKILHFQNLLWNTVRSQFYRKYGVQDYVVRKEYMDLVRSGAYEYPYDNQAKGYIVILWNLSPRGGADYPLEFTITGNKFETLTEFISEEHMAKCKITPKIEEAFLILRYFSNPDFETKSFLISAKASNFDDLGNVTINDYKVHLIEPDGE